MKLMAGSNENLKPELVIETLYNFNNLQMPEMPADIYRLDLYADGESGYKAFLKGKYDLCVLDVMMPKKDGFSLCKDIKQINPEIPVVFLTAKALKEDVIDGFKLGADDYITKPFSMEELTYRIDAIMHRVQGKKKNDEVIVTLGKFTFDRNKQILAIGDDKRKLTTKESELLNILYEHVNDVLPRELALNKIWEDDNRVYARSMDVYITKLRKYLKADPDVEILNVHGEGYKLVLPTA
jgi:DNA-binding response OmpR family regulator